MQRISNAQCTIPKHGDMQVPGKLFISEALEENLDAGSVNQVENVAKLPGIVGESIAMPDIHIGYGFPIGGVAAFDADTGIISPGGIGFDINCGVRVLTTTLKKSDVEPLIAEVLDMLGAAVPAGTGRDSSIRLDHKELENVLKEGSGWALSHGYATEQDIAHTEERGCIAGADVASITHRAKDRGVNQLGTLGAGNHFLELQTVEKIFDAKIAANYGLQEGQIVVMIHCGSRGLGHQVCSDYLQLMEEEYPQIMSALPEKNLMYVPRQSELGKKYWGAMAGAANFAWCNRQIITHFVRKALQRLFPGTSVELLYDVSHNIAKIEEHKVNGVKRNLIVHRKGATRAFPPNHKDTPADFSQSGQPVLIPGSMGTSSYILAGAQGAMENSFGSCCHGAGRKMSRQGAIKMFKGDRLRSELKAQGITVRGSNKGLVEEAPGAYKDVDEVIKTVTEAGLAISVARCVPLGVIKG